MKATGMDVGAVRRGFRARQDEWRRGVPFRSAAAGLFRGTPAEPGGRGRADRGHREGRRGPCRDARRADYGERIAVDRSRRFRREATLIPSLENQVFVVTSYPDGTPAVADVKVHAAGNPEQSATTDDGGVAVMRVRPGAGHETVQIEAADKEGNHATRSVRLGGSRRRGPDSAAHGTRGVSRRRSHSVARVFDQEARHGLRGCGQGRADRADARPGYRERPGGAGADRHAGPGGHARFPRLPVRAGRAGRSAIIGWFSCSRPTS